jgi:hypothetical protein
MPSAHKPLDSSHPAVRIAAAILLALTFLWCIYWFVHAWHYWEDDAYIHLEFARSLAAGRGFTFNNRVVAGDTAPLWVFLLAATHTLIPGWLVADKLLTVLGAALSLTGLYAFARRLAASLLTSSPDAALFPAAILLLVVANPYTCYWIFSGMEPLAASGLAFFAVLAATQTHPSIKSLLAACLLAGIMPLLRPEMIFLTALLALPLLAQWRRLSGDPTSPSKLASFASGLFLAAAPVLLWSLYSLHAFGHLLPNTNAAKRAAPADSVVRHLISIYAAGFPLILCGLAAGILYLLLHPAAVRRSLQEAIASAFHRPSGPTSTAARPSRTLPLAGWIFLLWPLIATLFYIANHTYVQTRYILVTAPALTLLILLLALQTAPLAARILYISALAASLAISVITVRPLIRNKAFDCQTTKELALFIHDRIPLGAPVADYSIGEIAFFSQHPILDTSGITRPGAVPYLNAPPPAMLLWARSQGAQYWIGNRPTPDSILIYSVNQRFATWSLRPALYATTTHIELWKLPTSPAPTQ